jgi:uncharacterized protein YoxC
MEVTTFWWIAFAAAVAVAAVVALLLIAIIATARSIDRNAAEIWTVGKQIAGNTVSIWLLDRANKRLEQIDDRVRSLHRATESLDEHVRSIAGGRSGGS